MNTTSTPFLIIIGIMGILIFFKPVLIYHNMKSGGKGVSPLNLFMIGLSYFAIAIILYMMSKREPGNAYMIYPSIFLVLLGFWNLLFAYLVKQLANQSSPELPGAVEKPSTDEKKDNPKENKK